MRPVAVILCLLLVALSASAAPHPDPSALAPIAAIVRQEIDAGRLPGAVVLIGNEQGVVYRHAFGARELRPERLPMTEDTVFDLASLTKPLATATAVMQLAEQGRLELDAPAARYWPAFGAHGKEAITLRQLLTHYSGLRADLDLAQRWSGREAARARIVAERPLRPPGTRYLYSDINFEVLQEVVERVAGQGLDAYSRAHIFAPLGMRDTAFEPPASPRIAPTEGGLRGTVHDPTARRMGGVAGHAGLFSSADDLARFARMMLAGGALDGVRVLQPGSIAAMTAPQSPAGGERPRGLGWDLAPPFAANRTALPPVGAYGHTGFTGTSLWIDPVRNIYAVLLSNRVHPRAGDNDAIQAVRRAFHDAVVDALTS
jgi:CubicO group peptidase (beta-lactamase class C family)